MAEIVMLTKVRVAFPNIVEPQKQTNTATGETRETYNADLLLEQSNPGFGAFWNSVQAAATEKWKEMAPAVLSHCQTDRRLRCYGTGNEKINQKTMKVYDGYEGMAYISVSNKHQPQIIGGDGKVIDPANTMAVRAVASKIYGGCYVNAAIKVWLQENKHGRGVRCELVAIQFAADGTPFGAAPANVDGMFGQVAQAAPAPNNFGGAAFPGAAPAPQFGAAPAPAAPAGNPFGAAPFPS